MIDAIARPSAPPNPLQPLTDQELAYAALQKRRRKAPVAPCLGFDPAIACALLVDDLPGVTSNLPVINLKVIGEITQVGCCFCIVCFVCLFVCLFVLCFVGRCFVLLA